MINVAELLKDAQKGIKLYSPLFGEVEFAEVIDTGYMPIRVMKRGYGLRFDEYGRYMGTEYPDSECLLFPSKDCRTWEGWKLQTEPKFKAGDNIKTGNQIDTIAEIDNCSQRYYCESGRIISFANQDLWHLVPKKHYGIASFHAGMPVLVRDSNKHQWKYVVFSHNEDKSSWGYKFNAAGTTWAQCIPYNDETKHLLGTTEMCPEEFINW